MAKNEVIIPVHHIASTQKQAISAVRSHGKPTVRPCALSPGTPAHTSEDSHAGGAAAGTAARGLNPFELLGYALDAMVSAEVLPAERRPGAEYLAWSAVHGMALLIIDGPLRAAPAAARRALAERLLVMVENGL